MLEISFYGLVALAEVLMKLVGAVTSSRKHVPHEASELYTHTLPGLHIYFYLILDYPDLSRSSPKCMFAIVLRTNDLLIHHPQQLEAIGYVTFQDNIFNFHHEILLHIVQQYGHRLQTMIYRQLISHSAATPAIKTFDKHNHNLFQHNPPASPASIPGIGRKKKEYYSTVRTGRLEKWYSDIRRSS